MLFTIGFAGACGVWCCLPEAGFYLLGGICLLAAAAGLIRRGGWKQCLAVCLGFAVGAFWWAAFAGWYLAPARQADGQTMDTWITVSGYSRKTGYGTAVEGKITLNGRTYGVRVYLDEETEARPGDTLSGAFTLRCTLNSASAYDRSGGIFLLAYPAGQVQAAGADGPSLRYLPQQLRAKLLETLDGAFPADTAMFARAVLVGETSGLDYGTDTALKLSGIRHVVAVSGLHVGILFAVLSLLTASRRYLTLLLGIPALALFAAMAGFTPSVSRACVMELLFLTALCADREYDPPTALAFAALLMLGANPYAVASVSLQLSVASVAGIFLFAPPVYQLLIKRMGGGKGRGWKAGGKRWAAGSISVSVGAAVLTTPFSAWYFGTVSLAGVVTNLLTLWAVTLIFCGVLLSGCLGLFWLTGAKGIAWGVSILIRYVLGVAKTVAGVPLSAVYTRSLPIAVWLAAVYVLFGLFLLYKRRRPGIWASCAAVGLCAALMVSWLIPLRDSYRLTVLDVGQGQCVLLQSDGRTYMVDCGGSSDTGAADIAAETLLSQGVTRLDGLILTHYDSDHVGAAGNLLSRVPADCVFLPATAEGEAFGDTLRTELGEQVLTADADLRLEYGGTVLTILTAEDARSGNESGLCVLFQKEKCDILVTGDRGFAGEAALLHKGIVPPVDILVAGHHGAASSTGQTLLSALTPETVVISVGANSYGHPAEETLARLEKAGCTVRRTDIEGTIIIRG